VAEVTREELLERLRAHEDNFVERKSDGLSPAEIRETASAFANTVEGRSGLLFIGVHDKTGAIVGVRDTDQIQMRVREACHGDCYPPITYTSEVLMCEGEAVVVVVVPPSTNKPHFTGPAFVRVGSESVKATPDQFEALIRSHVDKCREILNYRGRGPISVRGVGYKLGTNRPVPDEHYVQQDECIVKDCTADVVTLESQSGPIYSEPLERIEIGYDGKHSRPMLIVRFPPS
jgi:hypothetical protein